MFYGLSDGRYHVFLWFKGGRRPAHEEFDTPGEARAFLRGLSHLQRNDRHFYFDVLTLDEYANAGQRGWWGDESK